MVCPRLVLGSAACVLGALALPDAHADEEPRRFRNATAGAIIDASVGASSVGDTIMGELGGAWNEVRSSRHRRWLLQWEILGAMRSGWLAQQYPFLFLLGAHGRASGEVGYRFSASAPWSAYAGARFGGDASWMVHPGEPMETFRERTNVDGVGAVTAEGALRLALGVSFLGSFRSLLLVGFAQEARQAERMNTPSLSFTEGGIAARLDVAESLTALCEGLWGVSPAEVNAPLGLSDRTTRLEGSATLRKRFANGMWVSASGSYRRDTDRLTYAASGTRYDTAAPATLGATLLVGVPLWGGTP